MENSNLYINDNDSNIYNITFLKTTENMDCSKYYKKFIKDFGIWKGNLGSSTYAFFSRYIIANYYTHDFYDYILSRKYGWCKENSFFCWVILENSVNDKSIGNDRDIYDNSTQKIMGFLTATRISKDGENNDISQLNRFRVNFSLLKDYRNKGLGTSIIRTFIPFAKNYGMNQLSFNIRNSNTRAIHFFTKLGAQKNNDEYDHYTLNVP